MASFDQLPAPQTTEGCGIVTQASRNAPLKRRRTRRTQLVLEIDSAVFTDIALGGLVDDWLVPVIVEQVIQRLAQPPSDQEE